jgi:hypothetical protein
MRLVFSGHHVNPVPVLYVDRRLGTPTYGDTNGSFRHNGTYNQDQDVLTVSFNLEILLVSGLDPATEASVRAHEAEHRRDFAQQAERLRQAIQRALHQGRDHQIDARWDWFNYDLREAANEYHRRVGQGDIIPNVEPGRPRPV